MENIADIHSTFIVFVIYFTVGLMGAFTNDTYKTVVGVNERIEIKRILVGAMFTAFLLLFIDDYFDSLTFQTKGALGFLTGILGFELFGKINTVGGLEKVCGFLKDFIEIFKTIRKK